MKLFSKFILITGLVLGISTVFGNLAPSKTNNIINIAVVDVNHVIQNYDKVNILKDQQKVKLDELKKFVEDARKKIADEKDAVKKKALEEKYNKELQDKKKVINTEYQKQLSDINKNVTATINNIGETGDYDIILVKSSVLYGGKDITSAVLKALK